MILPEARARKLADAKGVSAQDTRKCTLECPGHVAGPKPKPDPVKRTNFAETQRNESRKKEGEIMKKILSIVALIAVSASLVACGGEKKEAAPGRGPRRRRGARPRHDRDHHHDDDGDRPRHDRDHHHHHDHRDGSRHVRGRPGEVSGSQSSLRRRPAKAGRFSFPRVPARSRQTGRTFAKLAPAPTEAGGQT